METVSLKQLLKANFHFFSFFFYTYHGIKLSKCMKITLCSGFSILQFQRIIWPEEYFIGHQCLALGSTVYKYFIKLFREDDSTIFLMNSIWIQSLCQEPLLYALIKSLIKSLICNRLRNINIQTESLHVKTWLLEYLKYGKITWFYLFPKTCVVIFII